jgi:hypothetical protein
MATSIRLSLATKFNLVAIALVLITSLSIALFVVRQNVSTRFVPSSWPICCRHGGKIDGIYTENGAFLSQIIDSLAVDAQIAYVTIWNQDRQVLLSKHLHPGVQIPSTFHPQQNPPAQAHLRCRVSEQANGQLYIDILAGTQPGQK